MFVSMSSMFRLFTCLWFQGCTQSSCPLWHSNTDLVQRDISKPSTCDENPPDSNQADSKAKVAVIDDDQLDKEFSEP